MLGAAFYNLFIPEKNFEYLLMPMYSFGPGTMAGGGNIGYNFYPGKVNGKQTAIRKIKFDVGISSYHFENYSLNGSEADVSKKLRFVKIVPELEMNLRNADRTDMKQQGLAFSVAWIKKTIPVYIPCISCDGAYGVFFEERENIFPQMIYFARDSKSINTYHYSVDIGLNENFFRVAAVYAYHYSYRIKNHGFSMRAFAGWVSIETGADDDYRLHMSGLSGKQDYLFDHVFIGRTETDGILSQQFVADEGGFKAAAYTGQSESWLAALNLETNIPGRLPVKLFFDMGASDQSKLPKVFRHGLMFDYGAEVIVVPDIFSVYFPLGYSKDIQSTYDVNPDLFGKYTQRIRFELKLEKLNPLKLRDKIPI